MAGFLRGRALLLSSCGSGRLLSFAHQQINNPISCPLPTEFSRTHSSSISRAATGPPQKSPLESNILRLLRSEIDYQSEYAPTHQPAAKFKAFTVEDRPGEQWITLRGKSAGDEYIKIEATMFDGSVFVPKSGDESTGEDVHLHISLLVDIWKGEGNELLEFVCSTWPDSLEIQKVYTFQHGDSSAQAYMGPNVKDLNKKLRNELYEFLKTRGVNDELSAFLHEYMMNKDRVELIQWMGKVNLFMER